MLKILGNKEAQGIEVEEREDGKIALIIDPKASHGMTAGGNTRIASTLGNQSIVDLESGETLMKIGMNAWR